MTGPFYIPDIRNAIATLTGAEVIVIWSLPLGH